VPLADKHVTIIVFLYKNQTPNQTLTWKFSLQYQYLIINACSVVMT